MTMKKWLVAAAIAMAVEGAALACSCMNTNDPAELRRFGAEAGEGAVALVEIEVLTAYAGPGSGEELRVLRIIAGAAPARFQVERADFPSGASCDVEYTLGQRGVAILYPSGQSAAGAPVYRTSGLCTVLLLDRPAFRDAVIRRIGGGSGEGERG